MRRSHTLIRLALAFMSLSGLLILSACSHSRPIKSEAYARLADERVVEYDFATTWKGVEEALRKFTITDRNPQDVDFLEMKKLTHRTLKTDWIYGRSTDQYVEYSVNGSPRKQYVQTRVRYTVKAESVIGGTDVKVTTEQEVEGLKPDGTSAGYRGVKVPDSSKSHDLLQKIQLAILSAAP